MNRMIPIILALMLVPLALADQYDMYYPSSTASPAVAASQATQTGVYRTTPLVAPQPMGVARDVRFLPPAGDMQLALDENGVVTGEEGTPLVYGTTGGSFSLGHNPWRVRMAHRLGPYFSRNEVGFKTSMVQTSHYQKDRGRTYTSDYLGYHAPIQVLKQWGGSSSAKYIKPGIPGMIVQQPQYVNPGLPGQPTPMGGMAQ